MKGGVGGAVETLEVGALDHAYHTLQLWNYTCRTLSGGSVWLVYTVGCRLTGHWLVETEATLLSVEEKERGTDR